jgi:hypothetical protein
MKDPTHPPSLRQYRMRLVPHAETLKLHRGLLGDVIECERN